MSRVNSRNEFGHNDNAINIVVVIIIIIVILFFYTPGSIDPRGYCYCYLLLLFFLEAHQHKATGRKTRLDIQNYGCNSKLLCDHGVVESNRISSLQSH